MTSGLALTERSSGTVALPVTVNGTLTSSPDAALSSTRAAATPSPSPWLALIRAKATLGGTSLSWIVNVCTNPAPSAALVGAPRVTSTVSSASSSPSSTSVSTRSALRLPAGITSGSGARAPSAGRLALPATV